MATQVNLMTSDNQQFTVDKAVAQRSVLIKNMLEGKSVSRPNSRGSLTLLPTDLGDAPDQVIPLPNVTANVLKKVCDEYCHCLSHRRLSDIFPKSFHAGA